MNITKNKKLGLLGYGYTAKAFATSLVGTGYKLFATTRKLSVKQEEYDEHITLVPFNKDQILTLFSICDALLISIPPDGQMDDPVTCLLNQKIIEKTSNLRWIAYLSSTNIYGDHQGSWVSEESKCINPGPSGRQRLVAENAWYELYKKYGLPVHIFRLAGIYGPQRSALDRLKAGKDYTIYKAHQVFSRIHINDICQALTLSLESPTPGEYFNVSDDTPASVIDVDSFAAQLLNLPKPELIEYHKATLSPLLQEFFQGNKRVSNAKLKQSLNWRPSFPSYKEGLIHLQKFM